MIRKRFQGMAENSGEKEVGFRVSQVKNMAGSCNGGEPGFDETQAREEKAYVRTRRRPHRKLRLFEDDDDDDVGVIGEGFSLLDGIGGGFEMDEVKGSSVGPTGEAGEIDVGKISDQEGLIGKDDVDVDDGCAEFWISRNKNEADAGGEEFGIGSTVDVDDGSAEFGILCKKKEADGGSAELGGLSKKNEAGMEYGASAEFGILGKKPNEADVDDKTDHGSAQPGIFEKKNEGDVDEKLSVEKHKVDVGDRLSLEKIETLGERLSLEKNEDAGERLSSEKNEDVEQRLSRKRNAAYAGEGNNGSAEHMLSRNKSEAAVVERDDVIAEFSLSKKKNEVDDDGMNNGSAGLVLLTNKNEAGGDGRGDGNLEFRILRKRKRVVQDDLVDMEDGNAKLMLERKRGRRVVDNDCNKGKEDTVTQTKLIVDDEFDRKSSAVEVNKSLNRKKGGASTIKASQGDVHAHKSSGNSGEPDSGKKIEKKLRDSRADGLSMGVKKVDHRTSNGAGIESLMQGILLRPTAGDNSGDRRIQRNKSWIGVGSSVMDECEIKSTHHLKQRRVGAVTMQLGSKALDRDSLRRKKSDVEGKNNAAVVSPKSDSLSVLQKQKNFSKSSPILQKETKIAKERKAPLPSLAEETKRMKSPLAKETETLELALAEKTKRLKSPLAKETKTPGSFFTKETKTPGSFLAKETKTPGSFLAKETKAMQRIARSEDRKRLRERLRDALLVAGWKIDLRPRKGKNYDDNVYISPSGTSFWSLPKAWNALKGSMRQNSRIIEGISGSPEESKEAEAPKQADRARGGEFSAANMLVTKVCDEDLSLLQRKRRRAKEDNEKKDGKRKKRKKSSHEVDGDGIIIADVKIKEEMKRRDESKNKIKKDSSRVKIHNPSCKVDIEGVNLSDVKMKEKKKKMKVGGLDSMVSNSTVSEKRNINDKLMHQTQVTKGPGSAQNINSTPISGQNQLKRRLHGESERKHSTLKAVKKNKSRRGGCGLLVRSSKKGDGRLGEQGVSTVAKRTVISWLVDVGVVPENECVQYWNKKGTRIMLEGLVRKDGILCECCNKMISISKFEDHAGATRHRPFENIYLSSGKSLTQCLREAWDTQEESRKCGKSIIEIDEDDQNDDTCGLCGDGGDLICCDKCPSTFHQDCLELKSIPEGDWYCLNCTCGICGAVGHVGENPTSKMTDVLVCEQCEHEYHKKCIWESGIQMLCSDLDNSSFCGKACQKVCDGLDSLLGTTNPLGDSFSWTLLRRFDDDQHISSSQGSIQDRMAEINAKLSVAHIVMDECFMPIVDKRTNIDMVSNVVFSCWSNFNRLNYQGFYTAVLEKDDEIISVASIRIHGTRLAEMPLIGTRHHYRRQGMCRRLVNAIEKMLLSLQVEKLILPAVPDLLQTWTAAFGFNPLGHSHKNEIRHLNLMVFPGTDLLQKQICNPEMLTYEPAG